MTITVADWKKYIDSMEKVCDSAKEQVQKYIETHEVDSEEGREALIEYCYALATKYGEAAATLACQMYDAISEFEGANVEPAEPAETATFHETAKSVNGTINNLMGATITAGAIGRLVKMAGQDTTLKNAIRDRAYFAWIPMGDTCPYCLAIAAEGWQRAGSKTLSGDHAKHIHGNCNCAYSIKHNKETEYKAYNPEDYQEMFEEADGDTEEEKINSVRRMTYSQHKDRINEQKREIYALSKDEGT